MSATRDGPGNGSPAAEDPLVELARIVHKNKQSGANVSSGRVGSTDYFAGLEDVAGDSAEPVGEPARREPAFTPAPVETAPAEARLGDDAPETSVTAAAPSVQPLAESTSVLKPGGAGRSSHVSSLWPDIQTPATEIGTRGEAAAPAGPSTNEPDLSAAIRDEVSRTFEPVAANDATERAPELSVDLEQNLTAELEDELIGALRQSVDENQPAAPVPDVTVDDVFTRDFSEPVREQPSVSAPAPYRVEPETPSENDLRYGVSSPAVESFGRDTSPVGPVISAPDRSAAPASGAIPVASAQPGDGHPDQPLEPARTAPVQRPKIDENDLFAALNPVREKPVSNQSHMQPEQTGDPAGIDALFADLDFPPPGDRKAAPDDTQTAEISDPSGAADIDDMTWPAAAAEVPRTEEEETPPPPEGYDLDAVARAMQESDPSLTGAGVLPPHSTAEKKAVPHAGNRSRRGLYVAAGVMGVAVLGAAGFFLIDGDGVVVPSGPPPVISGLQEPLKIYPEQSQAPADNQTAKLDYSRVDGSGTSGPDRLVLPESPQPAELPPAPAGTSGGADLVPGAPKQVRTVIVRPDGSFVTEDDPAPPAASAPSAPVTEAPAPASPVPAAPAPATDTDGARTVTTTPVVPDAGNQQPTTPEPAITETPAVVAATEDPAVSEPAPPVPTVLPRKKPEAPVRVASTPPAATAPATTTRNDGPLNLTQQPSVPAQTATGATGTIASGTYIVQVTSQRSAAAASDAYSGLQRRYPSILGNRNAVIVSANVEDRGVFYRARIPTTSRDEAISLCENLQAAGGDCFVRRQP
ncbi:SPOR domain-containing protein [Roseibium sp. Sym1]|uniref:SPOR domain-containing protein n=1 Tax=Roseibium sp. Sym1 TaxID=3016006 RepID=UPI0022B39499|nr:SPOR domain-containing protein [Roseibium sp. Sym1]